MAQLSLGVTSGIASWLMSYVHNNWFWLKPPHIHHQRAKKRWFAWLAIDSNYSFLSFSLAYTTWIFIKIQRFVMWRWCPFAIYQKLINNKNKQKKFFITNCYIIYSRLWGCGKVSMPLTSLKSCISFHHHHHHQSLPKFNVFLMYLFCNVKFVCFSIFSFIINCLSCDIITIFF